MELVDMTDLNSVEPNGSYGFDSRRWYNHKTTSIMHTLLKHLQDEVKKLQDENLRLKGRIHELTQEVHGNEYDDQLIAPAQQNDPDDLYHCGCGQLTTVAEGCFCQETDSTPADIEEIRQWDSSGIEVHDTPKYYECGTCCQLVEVNKPCNCQ